jgi:hypothetical protein
LLDLFDRQPLAKSFNRGKEIRRSGVSCVKKNILLISLPPDLLLGSWGGGKR